MGKVESPEAGFDPGHVAGPCRRVRSVRTRLIHAGLGGWGRNWQKEAISSVPDADIVGVVDVSEESLALAREELGLAPEACFTSLTDALAGTDAEGVLITATVAAHIPLALEAMRAGKHVLVEKPFGATVAECREAIDLADELGLILSVSQNYRYYSAPRTVLDLVERGALGDVGTVHVDFRKWTNDRDPDHKHFHLSHALLYDMAIHHFDLMRMLLRQDAVEVYTKVVDPPWSKFKEEGAAALVLTFSGGTVVSYRGSWISSGVPTPWSGRWHLECEQGDIAWSGAERLMAPDGTTAALETVRTRPHGDAELDADTALSDGYQPVDLRPLRFRGRAGTLAAFIDAIGTGVEPETSGRRNLATLAICEAAAKSAASGRPEPVEQI